MPLNITTFDGEDELLTVPEVMDVLEVGKTTVRNLIREGLLKSTKHNGRTVVRRAWITEYWNEREREANRQQQERRRKKQRA